MKESLETTVTMVGFASEPIIESADAERVVWSYGEMRFSTPRLIFKSVTLTITSANQVTVSLFVVATGIRSTTAPKLVINFRNAAGTIFYTWPSEAISFPCNINKHFGKTFNVTNVWQLVYAAECTTTSFKTVDC